MNKQKFPAVPNENKIEELLAKIQPVPGTQFHQNMKHANWRVDEGQPVVIKSGRLKITFAIIVVAALTVFLVTPQGRAWAQEVVQFFRRVTFTSISLSPKEQEVWLNFPGEPYELPLVKILSSTLSPEMSGLTECQSPQASQSYSCQIAYAELKLGFDLKELPVKPEGWEIESLNFSPVSQMAVIAYKMNFSYQNHGRLLFAQGLGDIPDIYINRPWAAVPANRVEVVNVGSDRGEYVKGGFNLSRDGSKLIWNDSELQRLLWSDGTQWYFIQFWPNDETSNSINRDQLISMAASLVNTPIKQPETLDPNFLYSISDAKKLSGLDLKAPTLLPLGADFSSAKYLSFNDAVQLHYGPNDELVIYEWEGKSINFDMLSNPSNNDYEIVEVNGQKAFYGFSEGSKPYGPYWFLWWHDNNLNYQMYYYLFYPNGGMLNKKKMIAMAESMRDINASRDVAFKPYDYVSMYEQALGFDAKEFRITPVEWLYANVSAYPHPECIVVSYTSMKENGSLSLRQCQTDADKYFSSRNIPSNAIEKVKVRKSTDQYLFGDFTYDDNNVLIWQSSLPVKRVRWQENGLWMEIAIHGDSAVLYDQDDLISYAESLR